MILTHQKSHKTINPNEIIQQIIALKIPVAFNAEIPAKIPIVINSPHKIDAIINLTIIFIYGKAVTSFICAARGGNEVELTLK